MLCGNKTDQCPKCQKYIRRAVFAYHYENDCANLDESDVDTDRRTARKSEGSHRHVSTGDQPAREASGLRSASPVWRVLFAQRRWRRVAEALAALG